MSSNMIKSTLACMMFLGLGIIGLSQPCLPDGIQFTKQSQIDSFPINYPNCTEIEGSVSIEGLSIQNLLGLNSIISIGGNLSIHANYNLESLNGLNNLHTIGGDLLIRSNFAIINLYGLENLSTVLGDLWLYNNTLQALDGLSRLDSIGGTFKISQSIELQDIQGIANLRFIGGSLEILGNDSLANLQGFEGLRIIGGHLEIYYNEKLTSLIGLDNVDSIGKYITIYGNYSLSTCAVAGICRCIAHPNGFIDIYNNTQGCNSTEEVQEICDTISIPENYLVKRWFIYPNPANNKLTISSTNNGEVTNLNIYNQVGHMVVSINKVNEPIDISRLQMGLYLVEFTLNGNSIRERIVKL